MKSHFELTDTEFYYQFENCTLDPALFSHEAHLRLAWLNINNCGIKQAVENIQTLIQRFVKHVGATGKYNKTLTIVATKMVYHFMQKSKSENVKDFITEYPQLSNSFRALIERHYSFDIFNLEKAKIEYLEPDLISFG